MEKNNLPLKIQILYGVGVSYAIVDQIFAQWVLYYYLPPSASNLEALLPPVFISIALVVSRFVDMVFDPLIGHISDRIETKWGRRMPFIAIGSLPLALTTIAYFYPLKGETYLTFLHLMIVGCLFFIFYTIVGAPYNALIPELASNKEDRLNLSTWQSVFRLLYTAIAMISPGILIEVFGQGNDEFGIRMMAISLSLLAMLGSLVTVFSIDERRYSGGKTSNITLKKALYYITQNKSFIYYLFGFMFFFLGFNTLRASINYYVEDIMGYTTAYITLASGLLFGMAALFFYPVNRLAQKIGYKKPMLISLVLLIILSLGLFGLDRLIPASYGFVIFALLGIPISGAAFIFPPAMLSEISAVESEKSGIQIEGIFFGIQGFFLKLAFLLSIAILPIVLTFAADGAIIEGMIHSPDNVARTGIYNTALVAIISFLLSFIFYFLYQEEKIE